MYCHTAVVLPYRRDGSTTYRVFQPVAVRICVEEGVGRRSSLALTLTQRDEIGEGERVAP